ncbi:MAG: class I SAM-dependent methyltransferase [Ignavibacteria bacterium]|nr:class I SAM-dependent methyltransferase [Ignavibacteria bacterium]
MSTSPISIDRDPRFSRRKEASTSILSRDYLVMQPLLAWMRDVAVRYCSGTMLDYGCGNRPYYELLRRHVQQYLSADVMQNDEGTVDFIIGSDAALPLASGTCDTVLSTQVLEHTRLPDEYLREAARVLKPGGYLILTCPGSYMLHEVPYDYYRFTVHGLEYLLERNGLNVANFSNAGGAWRVVGQSFLNHKAFGKRIPVLSKVMFLVWALCTNLSCALLDTLNMNTHETLNYMVVAQKRHG